VKLTDEARLPRDEGSRFTKYILPPLLDKTDPQGQLYHFFGYAARRLGQGRTIGQVVAGGMSKYYEHYKQNDEEDYYADQAGIWFAGGLEHVLEHSSADVTAQQALGSSSLGCRKDMRFAPPLQTPESKAKHPLCVITPGIKSEDGHIHRSSLPFSIAVSKKSMDETRQMCRAFAFAGFLRSIHFPRPGSISPWMYADVVEYKILYPIESGQREVRTTAFLTTEDMATAGKEQL
jgi:hypothetical protein